MNHFDKLVESCRQEIEENSPKIGLLSEKILHAVLKKYFCDNPIYHEQKVGKYYADILYDNTIIEIQTRSLNKLRDKLSFYLNELPYKVIIVYPIFNNKYLHWIDSETGEVSQGRKSPKHSNYNEIFVELYKLKSYLNNQKLSFCFIELDINEYRYLNGWSHNKKKGSTCKERVPIKIISEKKLETKKDYQNLIPDNLPNEFTSSIYSKCAGISKRFAQIALNVLVHLEVIEKIGKEKNSYIYQCKLKKEEI